MLWPITTPVSESLAKKEEAQACIWSFYPYFSLKQGHINSVKINNVNITEHCTPCYSDTEWLQWGKLQFLGAFEDPEHTSTFVGTTIYPSVGQMFSPPTKTVIGFSSSGCYHPMMQFHTQKQQVAVGTDTEKGNYFLQSKRIFLLLKQGNATFPGHVSITYTASRTSAISFGATLHLQSFLLMCSSR